MCGALYRSITEARVLESTNIPYIMYWNRATLKKSEHQRNHKKKHVMNIIIASWLYYIEDPALLLYYIIPVTQETAGNSHA